MDIPGKMCYRIIVAPPDIGAVEGEHMNQVNFQKELEKLLEGLSTVSENLGGEAGCEPPRLFLHSCCAPCSSYVLEYL